MLQLDRRVDEVDGAAPPEARVLLLELLLGVAVELVWVERFLWVLDLAMDATGARALVAAAKRMSLVAAAMQRIIYLTAWDESRYQGLTQYNFLAY